MGIRTFGHRVAFAGRKRLALAAAILFASAPARAAVGQQALFDGYVGSPAYRAILAKAYDDDEPALLKASCARLTLVSLDKPEIVQTPVFAAVAGAWQTRDGAWVQRATLDRCGKEVLRRVLVETASNNTLRTRGLLPGAFAGGFRLEETARAYVVDSMMNVASCKDWRGATVSDIALDGAYSAKGWSETWTALMCGKTVTARAQYVPFNGGTDVVTTRIKVH